MTYLRSCKILMAVALTVSMPALTGCPQNQSPPTDQYKTITDAPNRDTAAARKLYAQAIGLINDDKLGEAEKQLKAALNADLFFGPAHNNLGSVYFKQKKYYHAAWEFQYAAKLMPNRSEPRNNLGLLFETIGRLDEAAQWYDKALTLEPEAVETIANLARVYVRTNRKDEKTRRLLSQIVLKDQRPQWIEWARHHLAIIGQPKSSPLISQPKPSPLISQPTSEH